MFFSWNFVLFLRFHWCLFTSDDVILLKISLISCNAGGIVYWLISLYTATIVELSRMGQRDCLLFDSDDSDIPDLDLPVANARKEKSRFFMRLVFFLFACKILYQLVYFYFYFQKEKVEIFDKNYGQKIIWERLSKYFVVILDDLLCIA